VAVRRHRPEAEPLLAPLVLFEAGGVPLYRLGHLLVERTGDAERPVGVEPLRAVVAGRELPREDAPLAIRPEVQLVPEERQGERPAPVDFQHDDRPAGVAERDRDPGHPVEFRRPRPCSVDDCPRVVLSRRRFDARHRTVTRTDVCHLDAGFDRDARLAGGVGPVADEFLGIEISVPGNQEAAPQFAGIEPERGEVAGIEHVDIEPERRVGVRESV